MKISFITSGGGGGVDTNTWRVVKAAGTTLTGAPSGNELDLGTGGTGITITESSGVVTITNDNPTDTDENIANTDLTLDAARTTDLGGNNLAITNASAENLLLFGGSGTTVQIGNSTSSYLLPLTRPSDTQVLTATNGTGTIGWATPTPNTNTNLGTNNLTATATTRTMKVASGGTLAFQSNAGTQALKINNSAQVIIGASPYIMPTSRAAAQYDALMATDAIGGTSWETPKVAGGSAFMTMSGTIASWGSDNHGWFNKNGGNMLVQNGTNIATGDALALEMLIWDGRLAPTAWRFVGKRDGAVAAGLTLHIYWDSAEAGTPAMTFNQGDLIASGILGDGIADWQVASGTIIPEKYAGASQGDWFTFGFQAEDALANVDGYLTVYFSNLVTY